MNIRLLTIEEYEQVNNIFRGRNDTLNACFDTVEATIGTLPDAEECFFINGQCNEFPDDDIKCDVVFGLIDEDNCNIEQGEGVALFWNYQDGPAYNGSNYCLSDIKSFSAGGDSDFVRRVEVWINEH